MVAVPWPGGAARRCGTGQRHDADIWDNTALIKACHKPVASLKPALNNGGISEASDKPKSTPKRTPAKKNKSQKKKEYCNSFEGVENL